MYDSHVPVNASSKAFVPTIQVPLQSMLYPLLDYPPNSLNLIHNNTQSTLYKNPPPPSSRTSNLRTLGSCPLQKLLQRCEGAHRSDHQRHPGPPQSLARSLTFERHDRRARRDRSVRAHVRGARGARHLLRRRRISCCCRNSACRGGCGIIS